MEQQQPGNRRTAPLRLDEQHRAATIAEQALRLLYLDDVWRRVAGSRDDPDTTVDDLEELGEEMKTLIFECARQAVWAGGVARRSSENVGRVIEALPILGSLDGEGRERIAAALSDPARLADLAEQASTQLPREAQRLESELARVRVGGRAEGGLSTTGRGALRGMAAALALATPSPVLSLVTGVSIGLEGC